MYGQFLKRKTEHGNATIITGGISQTTFGQYLDPTLENLVEVRYSKQHSGQQYRRDFKRILANQEQMVAESKNSNWLKRI